MLGCRVPPLTWHDYLMARERDEKPTQGSRAAGVARKSPMAAIDRARVDEDFTKRAQRLLARDRELLERLAR